MVDLTFRRALDTRRSSQDEEACCVMNGLQLAVHNLTRKQQAELEFAEPGELEVEAEREKLVSHSAHVAERFAISRKALICASNPDGSVLMGISGLKPPASSKLKKEGTPHLSGSRPRDFFEIVDAREDQGT
jgi:hypothetical protein